MPMRSLEQPDQGRQIRVFVSSTFLDMQAERNHLVKFTFPRLRRLCESRGVIWTEVDLRWGVTDEQKAEGRILPICLDEIQRCRPYFIGLLGERYGWIPQAIPPELIEREPWLHEQLHGRTSVTELEIMHGVLRQETMHGHAYFYFRDPTHVERLSDAQRREFAAESAERAEKLLRLKNQIRDAAAEQVCVLREGYRDVGQLDEWVLEDFTRLIDRLFPEGSQPDPLDRDALEHEAYAHNRRRVYIGRHEYFDRLDTHVAGDGDRPLVILGESGSGKSALLANWATRYRQTHSDVLLIEHYIGATRASGDWAALTRRIMGEFKRRFDMPQEIPEGTDALRQAFPNWLHMASVRGRVVLVMDALNQLEDRDGAPDLVWLPPVMPPNMRVIISSLPGRALDECKKRGWPELRVEPLDVDERKQLVVDYLRQYSKTLATAQLDRIATAPPSANPLYLCVLLNELRLFGKHEELDERIGHYLQAHSPRDLFGMVIARWEQDYAAGSTLVGDTFRLLWAARRGLAESEIRHALGRDGLPLPHAACAPLFLAMADALVSRGGLLSFAHDFLRMAARDAYLPNESERQRAHLELADYFERHPVGPRRTDELPWQLAEAKAWERLQALLSDSDFFMQLWAQSQFDVRAYWTRLEENSSFRMVDVYQAQIAHPEEEPNKEFLDRLATCLSSTGHSKEALQIRSHLTEYCRASGNLGALQAALVNHASTLAMRGDADGALALLSEQEAFLLPLGACKALAPGFILKARILHTRGDLDGAMALFKRTEQLCRKQDAPGRLAAALGGQATILYERGDPAGAMALYQEQERIRRQLGDLSGLATSLGNRGLLLQASGELDAAMQLWQEQEKICRELGDRAGLASTIGNQALLLRDHGDLDGAIALLRKQEQICRETGGTAGLSRALFNQAATLELGGDLDGAATLLEQVEQICRQLQSPALLQAVRGNQAKIAYTRGDWDRALTLYEEEEQICRRLGLAHELQRTLGNRAVILAARGDPPGAMALHEEQERICREIGDQAALSASLINQSSILQDYGDLDGALARLKEAERISRELDDPIVLQSVLSNQATILYTHGDSNGALALFKEMETICRKLGSPAALAGCLCGQAGLLQVRGDFDGAMALLEEAEQISRELGDLARLATCLGSQASISATRGDLRGAMALHKESERIFRQLGSQKEVASSLCGQSKVLHALGDLAGAQALLEEVERILRALGDQVDLATTLSNRSVILLELGDLDGAMALLDDAEQIFRRIGNPVRLASIFANQAAVLGKRSDLKGALTLLEKQEKVCRESGERTGLAGSLMNQAMLLARRRRTSPEAKAKCAEALQIYSALGMAAEYFRARGVKLWLLFGPALTLFPLGLGAAGIALGLWKPWLWLIGGPLVLIAVASVAARFSSRSLRPMQARVGQWLVDATTSAPDRRGK